VPAIDIRIVPAAAFGVACCDVLLEAAARFERPSVGLATGATPVALYEELRARAEAGRGDVRGWRPFAIDEYVCAREDPCANRAFFERHWATIPGAPPVLQFDPEVASLEAEQQRFHELVAAAGGLAVAVLGIGMNGHLAFNEPGSGRESRTRVVALSPESRLSAARCFGETPTHGLTLGLGELLGAPRVVLLANGVAKAGVVARALQQPVGDDCPASFVREHPAAVVVLDEDAAGLLR
jgi:glucosamine-6-phosphate deaminase